MFIFFGLIIIYTKIKTSVREVVIDKFAAKLITNPEKLFSYL